MTSNQLTARFIELYIVFFVKNKERITCSFDMIILKYNKPLYNF